MLEIWATFSLLSPWGLDFIGSSSTRLVQFILNFLSLCSSMFALLFIFHSVFPSHLILCKFFKLLFPLLLIFSFLHSLRLLRQVFYLFNLLCWNSSFWMHMTVHLLISCINLSPCLFRPNSLCPCCYRCLLRRSSLWHTLVVLLLSRLDLHFNTAC